MREHGRSERLSADCLSKTQLRAKPKGAVYGVTLVRCRNVNGGSGMEQSVLRTPEAPVNDGSNYNCLKVGLTLLLEKIRLNAGTPGVSWRTRMA